MAKKDRAELTFVLDDGVTAIVVTVGEGLDGLDSADLAARLLKEARYVREIRLDIPGENGGACAVWRTAFESAVERKPSKMYFGCQAGSDGECNWKDCPQERQGEPMNTGRHCPLDISTDDEEKDFTIEVAERPSKDLPDLDVTYLPLSPAAKKVMYKLKVACLRELAARKAIDVRTHQGSGLAVMTELDRALAKAGLTFTGGRWKP